MTGRLLPNETPRPFKFYYPSQPWMGEGIGSLSLWERVGVRVRKVT
jgi:hypothetical protein